MRRRLISLTLTAAVVAGAVAFVATRDGDDSASSASAGSSLATRTQDAGEVTVKATLRQLDGAGAVAHLVFDTHAVELDLDVAAGATLTVDGAAWPTSGWEGDGPGGHHREGELRFEAAGPAGGDAVLSIDGLSEPLTFRWPAP
jgi:hypothetical protein